MKKRPKQHQVEDLSRAKFQLGIPEKWVVRDKDKDYGIDCEVELFDENENSTGLLFYVQLKATESKKITEIFNVNLEINTLKYFQQLDTPVLLARYSKYLDKIYVKWVNEIDLTFAKEKAKTFRIKIQENNELTEKALMEIENDLKNIRLLNSGLFSFPLTYSINLNEKQTQGLSNSQFKLELRNKLSEYSDFLKYKINDENFIINVSIENNKLLVQPSILKGVYFHNLHKRPKENFIEELSLDILLSLSICMILVGKADYCPKIIFENKLEKRLIEREDLLISLLPILLSSSYFDNTLDLVNKISENNQNSDILFLTVISFLFKSDTKNEKKLVKIEFFFKSRLERAKKLKLNNTIANSHYNLGNFYSRRKKFNESVYHYVQAKKWDSNYLKRSYFYKEIAGICFEMKKFWFSSTFYEKSIELGSSVKTKPLLADALMFSGNYKEAINVLDEYMIEDNKPDEEFLLKSLIFGEIVENTKIDNQVREQDEANKIAGNKSSILDIENALKKDLLSSLAWFNLGIAKKEISEFEDSTFCFTVCAIIDLWDIEAWSFAFLGCLSSNKKRNALLAPLVLKLAYKYNGDNFLLHLYKILGENSEENGEIIEVIDKILIEDDIADKRSAVLRLINGTNYDEIKLK